MTENINTYRYDFRKEALRLRDRLGSLGDKFLFIDLRVIPPKGGGKPKAVLSHTVRGKLFTQEDTTVWCKYIAKQFKDPAQSSQQFSSDGGYFAFVMNSSDDAFNKSLGAENKSLMRLFTLYHEAAHGLIIDGHAIDENHPYRECAADAHAALCLLQRFGKAAIPFLSMISWMRSYEALSTGSTGHLSTTVLDRIIADSMAGDSYSALTAAETIEKARAYAKQAKPTPKMLTEFREIFSRDRANACAADKTHFVMETGLSHTSQFAFYMGAKFFKPFTQASGIDFNNKILCYAPATRNVYNKLIQNRADITKIPAVAKLLGVTASPRLNKALATRFRRKRPAFKGEILQ